MSDDNHEDKPPAPWWVEYGPLIVFLGLYKLRDIYWATGGLMVALALALAAAWLTKRTVPPAVVVGAAIAMPFGALTLWLRDPRFIYLKPTILYALLAGVLLVGLARGRAFLKDLLGSKLKLSDDGWRALSLRFAVFWLVLAAANEAVWRIFTPARERVWVLFKFPGVPLLMMVFLLTQMPLLKRHAAAE